MRLLPYGRSLCAISLHIMRLTWQHTQRNKHLGLCGRCGVFEMSPNNLPPGSMEEYVILTEFCLNLCPLFAVAAYFLYAFIRFLKFNLYI